MSKANGMHLIPENMKDRSKSKASNNRIVGQRRGRRVCLETNAKRNVMANNGSSGRRVHACVRRTNAHLKQTVMKVGETYIYIYIYIIPFSYIYICVCICLLI